MTDNAIIPIETHMPHKVSEVICVKCLYRWIDVRPDGIPLKNLQCTSCREIGFVIETGEDIESCGQKVK